jgi:hypothetical protein
MRRIARGSVLAFAAVFALSISHAASGQTAPVRPKITGIDHVRLYVSDVAKSRAFYADVLGLPTSGGNCTGDPRPCFAVNAVQYVQLESVPSPAPQNWVAEVRSRRMTRKAYENIWERME